MKNWKVTIKEFQTKKGRKRYKVTRRLPEMRAAENKVFTDKKDALLLFEEWFNK